MTFETFARDWLATYPTAKGLKRSTVEGYKNIVNGHLVPALGSLKLEAITTERLEQYVATKRAKGLAARTLNRHLNLLSAMLSTAQRRSLVRSNPVSSVDRPREPRR